VIGEEPGEAAAAEAAEATPAKGKKAKAPKAPKEPKVKKLSALDAAAQVLAGAGKPMGAKDLIAEMAATGAVDQPGGQDARGHAVRRDHPGNQRQGGRSPVQEG
jgi:hypothetical protein